MSGWFTFTNRYYGIGDVWFKDGRIQLLGYTLQFTPGRLEDCIYYAVNNNAFLAMFFADNSANVMKAWRRGIIWFSSNSVVFLAYCVSYELNFLPETKKYSFLVATALNLAFLPLRTIFDWIVSVLLGFYLPIPIDDPLAASESRGSLAQQVKSWCSMFCHGLMICGHITKDVISIIVVAGISCGLYYGASLILFQIRSGTPRDARTVGKILFNYFFSMFVNVVVSMLIYEIFILPRYFKHSKFWDATEYFAPDEDKIEMSEVDVLEGGRAVSDASAKSLTVLTENPLLVSKQVSVSKSIDKSDKLDDSEP